MIYNQYYIPTRYPNGIPEGIPHDVYTAAQAKKAVELARAVLDLVKGYLLERDESNSGDTPLND